MDLCFVTSGTVNQVWQDKLTELSGLQLIVFGFNGLGLVSYKKELAGDTEYFSDLAKFSRLTSSVVICGCDTDTYGVFRHSAVIADKGKILGVSDMAHSFDDSEFVPGGAFRVYETSAGKIGVIVGEDLLITDTAKVMALCDADLIVCVMKKIEGYMPEIMLRASSFANGLPMILVSNNYGILSGEEGKIKIAGSQEIIKYKLKIEKDYRLISVRRRGITIKR
jgi:predicted amidohydrolase